MKDQVDQLTASGVAATFLNSTLGPQETRDRLAAIRDGRVKLVYLAPERLMAGDFISTVTSWNVTALAVDEAHCISELGHDFRPEYLRLRVLRAALASYEELALKPVFEHLGGRISYGKLRLFRAIEALHAGSAA